MRGLVIIFVLLFSLSAFADSFYVKKLRTSGVNAQDAEAISELILMNVTDSDQNTVVPRSPLADYVISPRVIRLNQVFIVSLKKYRKNKLVSRAKLKARTMDDMDSVIARLVKAILKNKSAKSNVKLDQVTDQEVQNTNKRIKATRQNYFGFGPAGFTNQNDKGSVLSAFAGRAWGINSHFDVKLTGFFAVGKDHADANFTGLLVELDYFLTPTSASLFFNGGFGYGLANARGGSSANGLAASLGLGFKFFRTSTVNLALIAKYIQLFEANTHGQPGVSNVSLAIYY